MDLGIECTPKPTRADNLKKLCTLDLPEDQKDDWIVYSYVCNEEVSKEDDLYGLLICLGHYPKQGLAERYAKKIAANTDNKICILRMGRWSELLSKPHIKHSEIVCADVEGNIVKLEGQQFKKEERLYEEQRKSQIQKAQEQSLETDESSVAHYKQEWLRAIKAQKHIHKLTSELDAAQKTYEKRCYSITKHYHSYPEHDKEWLKRLEELEYPKGAINLISESYEYLRGEVLGIGSG